MSSWRVPADQVATDAEIDAAMADTLLRVLQMPDCPDDPEEIQQTVLNYFAVWYPDLWASQTQAEATVTQPVPVGDNLWSDPASSTGGVDERPQLPGA